MTQLAPIALAREPIMLDLALDVATVWHERFHFPGIATISDTGWLLRHHTLIRNAFYALARAQWGEA